MALNAATLSTAMRAAMLAKPNLNAVDDAALTELCDTIADAVVTHVIASAVVTVPPGVPVATTGTAAAQAGATTAPAVGTIS